MALKYNPFLSIGLDYNDGNVGPQGPAGIYSSDYGAVRPSSITSTTYSNTAGTRTITTSAIEEMNDGDYVEVWVQNNTAATNITAAHLSLTVTEI